MNITINPTQKKDIKFPKLMQSHDTGNIYLMEDQYRGTCVYSGSLGSSSKTKVGCHFTTLDAKSLQDFEGTLGMSN